MDRDAQARAERRKQHASAWPLGRFDLGLEPSRDPLDRSTIDDRIALMWPLAKQAWSVAGLVIPRYDRRTMPGVLLRRER
jgi:hypothetical protein